ncbi:MAG: hypothetical protein U0V72_02265 [Cytophagales bacterium]
MGTIKINDAVVYFSVGEEIYLRQTLVSLLTLTLNRVNSFDVLVFTNNKNFFLENLPNNSLRLKFIGVDNTEVKQMKGDINFIHRVKIEVILKAFDLGYEKILYLDSDTLITKELYELFCKIDTRNSFMHLKEFSFNDQNLDSYNPTFDFKKTISANKFMNPLDHSIVPNNFTSSNAGVIGLHKSHINLIQSVLKLTDEIFPLTNHHATEQFMFSYILQKHTDLNYCEDYVYHYWYHVKKQIVDIMAIKYLKNHNSTLNLSEILVELSTHKLIAQDQIYQLYYTKNKIKGLYETIKYTFKKSIDKKFIKNCLYLLFKA